MRIETSSKDQWLRVIITENDPWHRETFFEQVDSMLKTIRTAINQSRAKLVLDLSKASHVDSSIITVCIQSIRMVSDQRVPIIASHQGVFDVLHLLGIDKIADVYTSETAWQETFI